MDKPLKVESLEEAEAVILAIYLRQGEILRQLRDHEARFDTLQTPFWKRMVFWINGWPWYDLNGKQNHRLWHRWFGENR